MGGKGTKDFGGFGHCSSLSRGRRKANLTFSAFCVENALHQTMGLAISKKPGQIGQIEATPNRQTQKVVAAAGAHRRQKTPKGKSCQAKPEDDPVEGEEAEEAEGGRRNKAADFGSVDRVKIEVLNLRTEEAALSKGLVKLFFQMTGVETGEIDKVQVEAGLSSRRDHQKGNQG